MLQPAPRPARHRWQPWAGAAGLLLILALAPSWPQLAASRNLQFALSIGLALGLVLQRSRFCFYCHIRDWLQQGEPRGVLAIALALAVGLLGMTVVQSSWVADPLAGRLPAEMHIGPVSWVLALAGAAFGLGMVVSGSCLSAHWYRLGEGSAVAPWALAGSAAGFALGFQTWNPLYLWAVAEAPVVWLPQRFGYGRALGLQLGALALLAAWVWQRYARRQALPAANPPMLPPDLAQLWQRLWRGRWNYALGGALIGLIACATIVRLPPLGVTATLGSQVRAGLQARGWMPAHLYGLDGFAGCATLPAASWATPNALLLLGLVAGSGIAALASRQFRPSWPRPSEIGRGLGGGLLLGWGAMTGLGCSVGTLLSGVMAGALSGWVFGAAMLAAIWLALRVARGVRGEA